MGFKENLRAELDYQGVKIKELAERSGVNRRTIDHYLMKEPQEPSVSNAVKIARALNVSVEYLVTGSDSRIPFAADTMEFINGYQLLTAREKGVVRDMVKLLNER